jgi:hypothetical protein
MWRRAEFDLLRDTERAISWLFRRHRKLSGPNRAGLFASIGARLFSKALEDAPAGSRPALFVAFCDAMAVMAEVRATVHVEGVAKEDQGPQGLDTSLRVRGLKITMEGDA